MLIYCILRGTTRNCLHSIGIRKSHTMYISNLDCRNVILPNLSPQTGGGGSGSRSVFDLTTRYGLDNPGFKSRWGQFSLLHRPLGPLWRPYYFPYNESRGFYWSIKEVGRGFDHPLNPEQRFQHAHSHTLASLMCCHWHLLDLYFRTVNSVSYLWPFVQRIWKNASYFKKLTKLSFSFIQITPWSETQKQHVVIRVDKYIVY